MPVNDIPTDAELAGRVERITDPDANFVRCPDCKGRGNWWPIRVVCSTCDDTGLIEVVADEIPHALCQGTGWVTLDSYYVDGREWDAPCPATECNEGNERYDAREHGPLFVLTEEGVHVEASA